MVTAKTLKNARYYSSTVQRALIRMLLPHGVPTTVLLFRSVLTGHAKVIGIADEQRVANAFVCLAIATRADAAETVLAFLFAPATYTNAGRHARGGARTRVRFTGATSERVSDKAFGAFTSRPLRRDDALRVVAAYVSVTRCKTKRSPKIIGVLSGNIRFTVGLRDTHSPSTDSA